MSDTKLKRSSLWLLLLVVGAIIVAIIVLMIVFAKQSTPPASDFASCKSAGGSILESYPERCVLNGQSFTNEDQTIIPSSQEYVGLSEEAAMSKASQTGKTARVVQRNGEDLSVTMDFAPGRLNLYIQDDKVYMVQVEGEE